MAATFTITEADYVRVIKLGSRPPRRLTIAIYSLCVVLVLLSTQISRATVMFAALVAVGAVGIMLAVRYGIVPLIARRNYRKYKSIQGEFEYECYERGVGLKSGEDSSVLTWDNILKWRENDEFILLYRMPRLYHAIPRSVLADIADAGRLEKLLRKNVGEPV